MKLEVAPAIEEAIQRHLASGKYDSPESVVAAALKQLDDYSQSIAEIEQSLAEEAAGDLQPFDEVIDEIRRKRGFGQP
jgi:predicted transcriptional regulator